jgi:hypothetical protein
MNLMAWYARVHHNIRVNEERSHALRRYGSMIQTVSVKDQKLFNVHLSELPAYEGA